MYSKPDGSPDELPPRDLFVADLDNALHDLEVFFGPAPALSDAYRDLCWRLYVYGWKAAKIDDADSLPVDQMSALLAQFERLLLLLDAKMIKVDHIQHEHPDGQDTDGATHRLRPGCF